MKRNVLASVFCFALMVVLLRIASATDMTISSIQPRFAQLRTFHVDLEILNDGCAQSMVEIELRDSSYEVDLTVELQRNNGWSWSTIKSWSASGTGVVSLDKDWYVSSGYTYRVYATVEVTAPDGTVVETVPAYSLTSEY